MRITRYRNGVSGLDRVSAPPDMHVPHHQRSRREFCTPRLNVAFCILEECTRIDTTILVIRSQWHDLLGVSTAPVASTIILSLRLLGLLMQRQPTVELARTFEGSAVLGLAIMLPYGVLMFIATAVRCFANNSF